VRVVTRAHDGAPPPLELTLSQFATPWYVLPVGVTTSLLLWGRSVSAYLDVRVAKRSM
jgi:hypothetical protein